MVPDTHLLKFLFAARYINYLHWRYVVLLSNFYMLPASQSDISTTGSFSRRVACDKLGLSVKGAGIAEGDD